MKTNVKWWLSAFVVLAALTSCTTFRIDPVTGPGVEIRQDRGVALPTFSNSSVEYTVRLVPDRGELMAKISLKNKTTESWRVADTDFVFEASDDGQHWRPLRVLTSDEYYSREKARIMAGLALVVMGTVVDQPTTVSRTTVYRRPGSTVIVTTRHREPSYWRNVWMYDSYSAQGQDRLEMLENNLFYTKDLGPGEEYYGLVFAAWQRASHYRVTWKHSGMADAAVQFQMIKVRWFD